jgi:hypothetical protein
MLSGRIGIEWNLSASVYADNVNILSKNKCHKEKQKLC